MPRASESAKHQLHKRMARFRVPYTLIELGGEGVAK